VNEKKIHEMSFYINEIPPKASMKMKPIMSIIIKLIMFGITTKINNN
jgi:hypothetical protein